MGRPLRKDVNGVDVIGTPAGGSASDRGIRVEAYAGGQAYTDATYNNSTNYAYIYKQRGAKTFVIKNQDGDILGPCVMQATTPSANGQMRLYGYVGGNGAVLTPLAKITKRVATSFTGVRYKWYIVNDSTSDYIHLTAI